MKYLTIDDICEMLSISRRTLERMRDPKHSPLRLNKTIADELSNKPNKNWILDIIVKPLSFPEPDLFIGRSPRWEKDKLISWLQENGRRLQD